MNAEEAKVPNVEKNWQSIEIFLFSNGQHNTPPRKYLLRLDELNLWDATLNQLAQSHYGLQSPLINLYTTDGNLVKGPLDLRDGHAYVAVAAPDTYVDAGYQKYLIKASRSWEKRQARKKPQECVPGDPCCLCPERERSCCDPETCCLCPEIEDEDSLEHILPATGHPESAGGHYVSSAPVKSDATDDYEPVSDKIGGMTYENRAKPYEGYPLVSTPQNSNEYGTRPSEYAARLAEDETRPNPSGQQPDELRDRRAEYDAKQGEYETRPSLNGAKPSEYATRPGINGGRPGEIDARPAEFGVKQIKHETRPSVNGIKPGEFAARQSINEGKLGEIDTRPGEYDSRPRVNGGRQGEFDTKPAGFGARLVEYETRPSINGAKPGEYAARPSIKGDKLGEFGARPDEYGTKREEYETRPSVNGTKPGEYASRPSINVDKPGEFEGKPTEFGAKPGENIGRPGIINGGSPGEYRVRQGDETKPIVNETTPDEYGARPNGPAIIESKPVGFGSQPGEYATRISEYRVMPSENTARASLNGARLDEYKSRPTEYETKPSANGSKPGEYRIRLSEYENRPSVNEVKQGEFGPRPAEYETKPNAISSKLEEYSIRPDGYRARQDEYDTKPSATGARPGEYGARQFEYRPSLNEVKPSEFGVKPDENETKASAGGAKPEKYGARLEKYENRPTEHGVRQGEYHTKRSANGSKLGEYGVRLDEYDTRSSLNGSKPGEFRAKSAEYGVRQAEYETKPSVNDTRLSEYIPRRDENKTANGTTHAEHQNEYIPIPSVFEMKPSLIEVKPGEYGNRKEEKTTNPDRVGAKGTSYGTKPRENDTKPDEFLTRPVEYASRYAERENKQDAYEPSPTKNGSWSGEYGDRTTSHKARPGHSGPWSGKIEPIKEAYEIALREKEKSLKETDERPDKDIVDNDANIKYENEYTTREVVQKDKEIEPKDMSRGNGKTDGERRVSGGEKHIRENGTVSGVSELKARKIENARRPNGRRGAEIEQGTRTAEPTRGFEHGGRISVQKARESFPAGRTSGQAVRLSVQKNRQSDNAARSGGRESRIGDHEARAGDIGFPASGHGLDNTGSREAEPSARAAESAVRANPRDKISSRPKSANLGQPKVGKPGTKIDEASARLDDSENKYKEDTSGARQSRTEGIGTSGALPIFEAQQNARKSTLSTGRPTIEKKRLSIGQNSSLLKKPLPTSSIPRKSEDRQPIKSNKDNLSKKINEKVSPIPVLASKDTGTSKIQPQCNASPATPPSSNILITNIDEDPDKDPRDNVVDEKEIIAVSTHSFKDPESETKSMMLDSVKHAVGAMDSSHAGTQTELIYIEKSTANASVNIQTDTEEVEKQGKEVSRSKEKVTSCTCTLCKPNHNPASDSDENTLSMFNKGGVVNIKLNIEVRNIVKSVHSCHKNCGRSRSLTNVQRPEKKSEIPIGDDVVVNRTSLQNLFNKQNFGGFGFESSPQVMVVQCAGCGKQNTPPRCDPPPCCDSNKKYFVLLNSVLEDIEDGCNFNPPCRPCDQRQSRRQSNGIPLKQAFSETTLDTITTVTVSGVPLQRREMGKCATNTSCQTEETQNECMATKRKVSISQDSVTKCDLHKKSSTSVCVATQAVSLVPKQNCLKMCSKKCEYEEFQVCSEFFHATPQPTCENVQSVCSHVCTCEKVQPDCSQVPPSTCKKVGSECSQVPPPTCEKVRPECCQVPPPTCEKVRPECCQVPPPTCEKVRPECCQVPPPTCEKVRPECCQVPPPTCEKVRPECCQVPPPTCEKVRPECCQVPPPTCEKIRPNFSQISPTCAKEAAEKADCSQIPSTKCEKILPNCSQLSPPTCEKVRPECCQVPPTTSEKIRPNFSQISPTCAKKAAEKADCSQIPSTKCEKILPNCSQVSPPTCEKVQPDSSQIPSTKCEKVRPVCSQEAEPKCEKVRSVCSQVSSQTCPQVHTKGCQSLGTQVQSQGRMPVTPTCPACCSQQPCLQIQACLPQPATCNAETQTRWASVLLQARLHCDGRYSFHLPPLHLLKSNCHSCCQ